MVRLDGRFEDSAKGVDDMSIPISAVAADDTPQPQWVLRCLLILYTIGADVLGAVHQVRVGELPVWCPVLGYLLGAENDAKLGVVNTEMTITIEAELVSASAVRQEPTIVSLDAIHEQRTRVPINQLDVAAERPNRLETVQFLQTTPRCYGRGQPTIVVRDFAKEVLKTCFVCRTQRVLECVNACPVRDPLVGLKHPGMHAGIFDPLVEFPDFFLVGLPRQTNAETAICGINVNVDMRLKTGGRA